MDMNQINYLNKAKQLLIVSGLVLFSLLMAGCDHAKTFKSIDLTNNANYADNFSLLDDQGNIKTINDYLGKTVILVIGFTSCPDICPTTLAELAKIKAKLKDKADKLQVIFVTVDWEKDTPEVLRQYTQAFDKSFIGLRPANEAELNNFIQGFNLFYSKEKIENTDKHTFDHTAASIVFDAKGKLRLYVRYGESEANWLNDLNLLIAGY